MHIQYACIYIHIYTIGFKPVESPVHSKNQLS